MAKSGLGEAKKVKEPPKPKIGEAQPVSGGGSAPAPQEHEGETYNPGTPSPTVAPFLTPEQAIQASHEKQSYQEKLASLSYALEELKANTKYEAEGVQKRGVQEHASGEWNLAGRGLEHSSIRDADLYDIDATSATQQAFLHENLEHAEQHTAAEALKAETNWNNEYMPAVHALEVENASNAEAGLPAYTVEPHWEASGTPVKTAAPKQAGSGVNTKGVVRGENIGGNDVGRGQQAGLTGVKSSGGAITAPNHAAQAAKEIQKPKVPKILGKTSG